MTAFALGSLSGRSARSQRDLLAPVDDAEVDQVIADPA